VEALGVNYFGEAFYNFLVAASSKLPWLQDTLEEAVWSKWGVTYRDVRIVDALGRLRGIFNLTEHSLDYSTNRTLLKQMFLDAARATDTDGDRLLDDWEILYFGTLSANPTDDPDQDGIDNATEFDYGTDPLDPNSTPRIAVVRTVNNGQPFLDFTFRRRAGAWLDYAVDQSAGLTRWLDNTATLETALRDSHNLFDGTGCLLLKYSIPATAEHDFFRLRASPKP
jgi:hypothetical protein